VLTLAQPFLTALVKQSGSPFYNHLLTPIFSSKHCSHNKMQIIEYVNELPEQGESIGLEHLSNVNVDTLSRL
jgi:hypothetical protein